LLARNVHAQCAPNSFACFYLALWLRPQLQAINYLLAHHVWALLSQTAFCSRQFYLTAILFGFLASPPHSDIPLALRTRPHMAKLIFYWSHDDCSFLFFSCSLTAKLNFYSPHGDCQIYSSSASSGQYSICTSQSTMVAAIFLGTFEPISFMLMSIAPEGNFFGVVAPPPHNDILLALRPRPLTAKKNFNWPHDEC
jgi:hypothetical protein